VKNRQPCYSSAVSRTHWARPRRQGQSGFTGKIYLREGVAGPRARIAANYLLTGKYRDDTAGGVFRRGRIGKKGLRPIFAMLPAFHENASLPWQPANRLGNLLAISRIHDGFPPFAEKHPARCFGRRQLEGRGLAEKK